MTTRVLEDCLLLHTCTFMGYRVQLSLELDAVLLPYLPSGRRAYGAQQGFGKFLIIKFEVDDFKLDLG